MPSYGVLHVISCVIAVILSAGEEFFSFRCLKFPTITLTRNLPSLATLLDFPTKFNQLVHLLSKFLLAQAAQKLSDHDDLHLRGSITILQIR